MTTQTVIDHAKLTSAISAKRPTGDSAIYEDEFEIISIEIAKLSSINQEEVDWKIILDNSRKLLTKKTKDLLLASYLSTSLFELHGYQGLKEGLQVLEKLTTEFWDVLYPEKKRMRGRAAAISWLNKRLIIALKNKKPSLNDNEHLEEIFRIIGDLDQYYSVEITENTPSFGELSRLLNEYRSNIQPQEVTATTEDGTGKDTNDKTNSTKTVTKNTKEKTKPGNSAENLVKETIKNSSEAPSNASRDTATRLSQADIASDYRQAQQPLKSLVADLRGASLNNPQHFYLNRISTWLSVTEVPMHTKNKTQLQAPATEIISGIQAKLESGDLENVITQIESLVPQSPFWFDAQRLVVTAMEEMGRPYETAAIIVKSQTFALLQRFPALLKMQFADGTPFASEQFKNWYKNQSSQSSGTTTSTSVSSTLDTKMIKTVQTLNSKGKLEEALDTIQTTISQGGNIKQKFMLRLLQAESCSQCDRQDLALPLYTQLDTEQQQYKLEEWDPELAIQILQGLLKAHRVAKNTDSESGVNHEEQHVFTRLCQLQPGAALQIAL